MAQSISRQFLYLLLVLILLNLLQAAFTELIFDEAYYWYYSRELAWGYFDHPPMVALMIRLGTSVFPGELGVRLIGCLMYAGMAWLLWHTIEDRKKEHYIPHFFLLIFAMPLINAYGFFTLPDTPLLFFTAFLLWAYKNFLDRPGLGISILLGILMAAMMYSKYQAALVIILIFLSYPRLALNRYAWMALGTGILCYSPHLVWLFENEWLTIQYHISERPNRAYEFYDFTLGYFLNLILIFGLIFPICYYAIFRQRASAPFKRALLFIVFGVLIFFFFSSFNRRIQTQWILVVCVPAILLIYSFILSHRGSRKWIFKLGVISAVILLYARLGLVFEPLFPITYESHGNQKWAVSIEDVAGDRPVVFENSYRNASMYGFYTGKVAFSLNQVNYRKNQYSLDQSEERVRGKEVLFIPVSNEMGDHVFTTGRGDTQKGYFIENFKSYRKLEIHIEDPAPKQSDSISMKLYNPYSFDIDLSDLSFKAAFLNAYKQLMETRPAEVTFAPAGQTVLRSRDTLGGILKLPAPGKNNHTYFRVVVSENDLFSGLNGKPIRLP